MSDDQLRMVPRTLTSKPCGQCPPGEKEAVLTCELHGVRVDGDYVGLSRSDGFYFPSEQHEREGIYITEAGEEWGFRRPGRTRSADGQMNYWQWAEAPGHMRDWHKRPIDIDGDAVMVRWARSW